METLSSLIALISILLFFVAIIGLIYPKITRQENRKSVIKKFLLPSFLLLVLAGMITSSPNDENKSNQTNNTTTKDSQTKTDTVTENDKQNNSSDKKAIEEQETKDKDEAEQKAKEEQAAKDRVEAEQKAKDEQAAKDKTEAQKIDITKIAGKSKTDVEAKLGKASSCETTKYGNKCLYDSDKVEIIFIDKKADWITIESLDNVNFNSSAIESIGLKAVTPSFENSFTIRWENIQNLLEVSVFPAGSKVDYAYIKVKTK